MTKLMTSNESITRPHTPRMDTQIQISSNEKSAKVHKKKASIGLGIVTHLTTASVDKALNNEFKSIPVYSHTFFDNISSPLKPPPSIRSIKKTRMHNNQYSTNDSNNAIWTFADRIRNIVLANRKNAAQTSISTKSTSHYFSLFKKSTISDEKLLCPELKVVLLPSNETSLTSDSTIPIINLSPNFSPNKTNIIPSLQEEPILGDIEITREHEIPSSVISDDNSSLIDKHIWKFHIQRVLGVGAFSTVYLAENLEDGELFAIKTINKERMFQDLRFKSSIEREVGLLKCLNHDKIVQLEATMETKQHLCMVLEYVQGGELFDFVQRIHTGIHNVGIQSSIDEILIKKLVLEIIDVVTWLHDRNIVHRDLKLENILVYFDEKEEPHIKITDFGLARVIDPNEPMLVTRCGSDEYAAPEIVQSLPYDGRLTDTWSVGILIYTLLVGYLPFRYNINKGEKLFSLFLRIVGAQVRWPANDNISLEAKEVVEKILVRQPDKRITLKEAAKSAWFKTM